jgi:competence protein ComFC
MSAVKIASMRLAGPWADGYVLERQHTLSSEFLGHDSFGNPQFDTKRTEMGELIYRLKNRRDKNTLDSIAETAIQFIKGWNPMVDLIVPMPPSRKRPTYQPVVEIAMAIGKGLSKPVNITAMNKIKDTPELKDVFGYQERLRLLQGAFEVDRDAVRDKRILLVDDLYRSGATATVAAQNLVAGGAAAVNLLAMTKTRTRT